MSVEEITGIIENVDHIKKINPINNTENCCCNCKGKGAECKAGGAWVYCTNLLLIDIDDDKYDETGETSGCNDFVKRK